MPPKQTAASKAVATKTKKHLMDELSEDEIVPKTIVSNPAPTTASTIISTGFEHPASGGGAAQTPGDAINIDADKDVIVIAIHSDGSDEDAAASPAQVKSPELHPDVPEAHPYVPQSPPQELS